MVQFVISIYFQRYVDIIWCLMLSTHSFSFIFFARKFATTFWSKSEEQTPKVAEAFMASSVMGSSAPFRSRDSQVGFWTQHFSWRNLYQTSPTAFSWGYVFRHLKGARSLEKTEGSSPFRGFPPGGCEVARFIGSEGKHSLHRFPGQDAPWFFRWIRLVPTRNVRSGFWKERQSGLWKSGIWRQEIQSSALVDHQLQLVKLIQNQVSGPCSFMTGEIWCPIFRQNWLLDTADSSLRLVPGQRDVLFLPSIHLNQQLSDIKVRITTVWGVEHQKK